MIPDDPLYCRVAFAEVSDTQDGQFLVGPVGYANVSILALVPEAGGEFGVSSLRFLYAAILMARVGGGKVKYNINHER